MGRPRVRTPEVRDRLMVEALRLLESDGPPALRARAIAEAADTSTGALYEFFGDKTGLVRALFFESFEQLDAAQRRVVLSDDPRADLLALMAVGRRFALQRPMLFELMFGRPFEEFDPATEDLDVGKAIYRRTVRAVARWLDSEGSPTSPRLAAEILVATHRGLVASELAGTLGRSEASRNRKYELGVKAVLAGLATIRTNGA